MVSYRALDQSSSSIVLVLFEGKMFPLRGQQLFIFGLARCLKIIFFFNFSRLNGLRMKIWFVIFAFPLQTFFSSFSK